MIVKQTLTATTSSCWTKEIFPYDLLWPTWCSRQTPHRQIQIRTGHLSIRVTKIIKDCLRSTVRHADAPRRQHFKSRGEREYREQRGQQPQDRGSFNSKLAKTPIAHPTNHRCS